MTASLIDTLAGNYRLVAKLGAGGMGEVYKGVHETIGSKVAIKVLHASSRDEPESAQRFLREARAVNLIDHDGVVKVVDAGQLANGRPYLVMELLDGMSLSEQLRAGTLEMADACRVMIDVLDALDAAHRVGVIHRDLKPANIFRTKSGRTVVLDFGIAKLMAGDGPARLTMMGTAIGTPHYMAPEQIVDGAVGPGADIYTAGIVLFELLCGRLPFDGATVHVMNGHLEQRPPPPRALRPDIPIAISDVVLKALQKEPDRRFPTAGAMRDALRAALENPHEAPASDATRPLRVQTRPEASPPTERLTVGAPPPPRDIPTIPVADTPRPAPAPLAPRAAADPVRRWPIVAVIAVLGISMAAAIVWKLGSSKRPSTTVHASDATAIAETTPDAEVVVVEDAAILEAGIVMQDALTAADRQPIDRAALDFAKRLESLRAYKVQECRAVADVEAALPHEDDPAIAEYHRVRMHYENALRCKHVVEYDQKAAARVTTALDVFQRRDVETATKLLRAELDLVTAMRIDQAMVERRIEIVRQLRNDPRAQIARGRIDDLLRDAASEIQAGRFASANIFLDEASITAWKSIRLRGG